MRQKGKLIGQLLGVVIGFCFLAAPAAAAEDLPAPSIDISPDIYYPFDEVLYLEGRAMSNSTVQLQFSVAGQKPLRLVTKSDPNGEWVFTERLSLPSGNWEVRARLVSGELVSNWSNPRLIKVIVSGIVIGGIQIKFVALIFVIVMLLIFGAAGAWLLNRRMRVLAEESQKAIREKEREAAEIMTERDFVEFRAGIEKELEHLEKRLPAGELTDEEREHRAHLLQQLEEMERSVEKRIKHLP